MQTGSVSVQGVQTTAAVITKYNPRTMMGTVKFGPGHKRRFRFAKCRFELTSDELADAVRTAGTVVPVVVKYDGDSIVSITQDIADC